MALMPRGQPPSAPDPLSDPWDRAAELNRRLQAKNDPFAPRPTRAGPAPGSLEDRLRGAGMPHEEWRALREAQLRGGAPSQEVSLAVRAGSQPLERPQGRRGEMRHGAGPLLALIAQGEGTSGQMVTTPSLATNASDRPDHESSQR